MSWRDRYIECAALWQPSGENGGWKRDAVLAVDAQGTVAGVLDARPADWDGTRDRRVDGLVVPGFSNLHSHAFQRILAGHAEHTTPNAPADSFWTWRDRMYAVAHRLEPEDVQAIAFLLNVELLERGFTSLAEFHYLHHQPDGTPYANPGELGQRVAAAAERAGMALTLLPVLYQNGGFDRAAIPEQRRFVHDDLASYLRTLDSLSGVRATLGVAAHSLRAVDTIELAKLAALRDGPIHIHIAEQRGEVDQCLRNRGARPVDWLFDQLEIDARWVLIHATHVDRGELARIAHADAVVGLCPSTEANLGDGLFPFPEAVAAGVNWGIGTDAHVGLDPFEELRWLELGQRLTRERRTIAARRGPASPRTSAGETLVEQALRGGARAVGQPVGALIVGQRADAVVLRRDAVGLAPHGPDTWWDALIFAPNTVAVETVVVGGVPVVTEGRHRRRDEAERAWRQTVARMAAPP